MPASTLRQWERRYGFPKPERSEAGYRLYSEVDVGHIDAMKRHISEGIPASRAAELVRGAPPRRAPAIRSLSVLQEELAAALSGLDEEAADRVLGEAFTLHPLADVVTGVMAGAARRLGELRRQGSIESALVGAACSYLHGRLRGLLAQAPAVRGAPLLLVGCAPGNRHELAPLILTLLLRRRGKRAHYLGPDLQLGDLAALSARLSPRAVLLSANLSDSLEALGRQVDTLAGLAPLVRVGGAALEEGSGAPAALERFRLSAGLEEGVESIIADLHEDEPLQDGLRNESFRPGKPA